MHSFVKGFISAIVLVAACSFTASFLPKRGESLLQEGATFYGISRGTMLHPFGYQGKYGFTGSTDALRVVIEPKFDDLYNTDYALVPVKMNGKWGAVDASGKVLPSKQPAIPCIYDLVEVCDDEHVYASKNGVKTKLDIMDFRNN